MKPDPRNNDISIETFPPIVQQIRPDINNMKVSVNHHRPSRQVRFTLPKYNMPFRTKTFFGPTFYTQQRTTFKGITESPNTWNARFGTIPKYKRAKPLTNPTPVHKEVYKISFPCSSGCANCSFTDCMGPVRVYVSQFSRESREPFVKEICDGQGRKVIPRHRRKELRGLVYDKETHSLHPPLPRSLNGCHKSKKRFF